MKTLKKIYLVSFLIGTMLTCTLLLQGNNTNTNSADKNSSLQLFVYAGENTSICDDDSFQTQGISSFLGTTLWRTSGDGFFENPYDPQTTYTPGEQDIANGEVTLKLLLLKNDSNKSRVSTSDSMTLYFGNCLRDSGLER